MGPSGSGKSTLLHCLAGILTPDDGEVWFAGQRLGTLTETQRSELRRDRFGFVFQSGQLVPPPACPRPAGSSGSPRCAWSARRPGRSR
jgi:ABC-type lipoprotein export system ATPase subunit